MFNAPQVKLGTMGMGFDGQGRVVRFENVSRCLQSLSSCFVTGFSPRARAAKGPDLGCLLTCKLCVSNLRLVFRLY